MDDRLSEAQDRDTILAASLQRDTQNKSYSQVRPTIPYNQSYSLNGAEYNEGFKKLDMQDKEDLTKYILNNRIVRNSVVRAAEVDQILFRNQRLKKFGSKDLLEKILTILYIPIRIATWVTVLPTTKREFSKTRYIFCGIFSPLFLFYVCTYGKILKLEVIGTVLAAAGVLCLIFGIIVLRIKGNIGPKGFIKKILYFWGFLSGLGWIWLLTDIAVSIIQTYHVVFNYQYIFMMLAAFSYLAWLPMSFGSVQTVKLLHDMPGFTIAVFNCYFVFGCSTLLQVLLWGSQEVRVWPSESTGTSIHTTGYLLANLMLVILTLVIILVKGGGILL